MYTSIRTITLRSVMNLAWQFVKRNGYTLSKALKTAWANVKLKDKMRNQIVKFRFEKIDGTIREAFGTLSEVVVPVTKGERKNADTCQTYYDTEKKAWRCFKKANLLQVVESFIQ